MHPTDAVTSSAQHLGPSPEHTAPPSASAVEQATQRRRRWSWPLATTLALLLGAGVGAAAGNAGPEASPQFAALSEARDALRDELAAAIADQMSQGASTPQDLADAALHLIKKGSNR